MVAEKGRPAREKQGGGVVDVFAPAGRRSQSTNPPRRCSKVRPEWESKPQRKARRTQRETTWYQGVASRQTRVERGWVMRGLLPWNRVAEEVGAVAVAVQAKWVSRGAPTEWVVQAKWVSRGAPTEWVSQRRRLPRLGHAGTPSVESCCRGGWCCGGGGSSKVGVQRSERATSCRTKWLS
jgi:hypothetical protein